MHYHILLLVLPYLVSSANLECFEKSSQKSLLARPLLSLKGLSVQKCVEACMEMPRESCKSFTYNQKSKMCQLNGKSKMDVKIAKNPMADYYHRKCFGKVARRRDVTPGNANCFAVTPGKVLIGIVDQLIRDVPSITSCQEHCANSQSKHDVTCKSAMYYEAEKECIIASQAKADIPDLFIDDDKSVYIENSCLDGSDKSITLKSSDVFKGSSKFSEDDEVFKIEKTTLATVLHKSGISSGDAGTKLEFSGYDGPSDSVSKLDQEDILTTTTTTTTTTPKPTTTQKAVNPHIVDSYNVVSNTKSDYGRRLRDTRVRECFVEVRPKGKVEAIRVVKAYSLEQCTDMCRLCVKCLAKQKKCHAVAFDITRELCALSAKTIMDGGKFTDDIIYHNRVDC
ncbi:unnamed protein product [Caenorhabditis bovis]|uniref:Apple domain-containing protein n=1 Tax=Caenorhabditis bovis TaxID=2654633 RepID=A0A8S1EA71_9PELO|nr:unnamed protein product [Caenorhabditis bovis]